MFQSAKDYVYSRRKGLSTTVGVVGGVYLVGRYIKDRLEEMRENVMTERAARENLRRRFRQNQEDVSYTIMALMPTLASQILGQMDVESLTQQLQSLSLSSRLLRTTTVHGPPPSESSLASSIEVLQPSPNPSTDRDSDMQSVSSASLSGSAFVAVEVGELRTADTQSDSASEGHATESSSRSTNGESQAASGLSDSFLTQSSISGVSEDDLSSRLRTKAKAELWREVKMLTFTRTLTTLYSATLLVLLTNVQLTLLARGKYVDSVRGAERTRGPRERAGEFDFSALLAHAGREVDGLRRGRGEEGEWEREEWDVDEATEQKYLTLSWWVLHIGWKDLGERVRRGVEEVFDGVSLKAKLSIEDLHRLVSDVRRRVEYEATFEGREKHVGFLSSLLPPTPETIQHVLAQNGIPASPRSPPTYPSPPPSHPSSPPSSQSSPFHAFSLLDATSSSPYAPEPPFASLLAETREVVASRDFECVLGACLDRAVGVLMAGVEGSVFEGGEGEGGEGEGARVRLAGMLPGLARWSHLALGGLPNELVDVLMDVREVAAMSAIMFARFEERFQ